MGTTLTHFRDRVTQLTGGDAELDAGLSAALGLTHVITDPVTGTETVYRLGTRTYASPPPLTSSVDAAMLLVERALPGWHWGIHQPNNRFRAYVVEHSPIRPMPFNANGHTPALALLLASLEALVAIEEAAR